MICFRDKSFCASSSDCGNTTCPQRFGPEERDAARKWWGSDNAPVAYIDFRGDDCGFVPVAQKEDE